MTAMISPDVPPHIAALKAYVPGLPISDLARRLGMPETSIAKLASNENPLGASPAAVRAVARAAVDFSLYPDNDCVALTTALATALGVPAEWLVVGAGSESLLGVAASALLSPERSAAFSQYSFQAFVNAVQRVGAKAIVVPSPDFVVNLEALLSAVRDDTRLVYLANPGNPTGTYLEPHAVESFLAAMPRHVVVVLDEAYCEYLPADLAADSISWVRRFPNLLVTRTFSKAYGLAGLRVGYGIAQPGMVSMLRRLRAPFSVTQAAQAAAVAALADRDFLDQTVQANDRGMAQLTSGLDGLGLRYVPSRANFLLVEVGDGAALAKNLEQHGLIVRPVAPYGLPSWLRISVGSESNNARLLAALEQELRVPR